LPLFSSFSSPFFSGYHTYCLSPPLSQVPESQWTCSSCTICTRCLSTSTHSLIPCSECGDRVHRECLPPLLSSSLPSGIHSFFGDVNGVSEHQGGRRGEGEGVEVVHYFCEKCVQCRRCHKMDEKSKKGDEKKEGKKGGASGKSEECQWVWAVSSGCEEDSLLQFWKSPEEFVSGSVTLSDPESMRIISNLFSPSPSPSASSFPLHLSYSFISSHLLGKIPLDDKKSPSSEMDSEIQRRKEIVRRRNMPLCRGCDDLYQSGKYCPICSVPYSEDEFADPVCSNSIFFQFQEFFFSSLLIFRWFAVRNVKNGFILSVTPFLVTSMLRREKSKGMWGIGVLFVVDVNFFTRFFPLDC
jgi:hypothetical protein